MGVSTAALGVLSEIARSAEVRTMAANRKRQLLLRDVNARIREISDRFGTVDETYRLICECGRADCEERVDVPVAAYDDLRRKDVFLVAPAHEEHAAKPGV